jgi:hypothetical protein
LKGFSSGQPDRTRRLSKNRTKSAPAQCCRVKETDSRMVV